MESLFFRLKILFKLENYCSLSNRDIFKPTELKKERAIMALERFWWWPSLDLLRDSCNGALWLEHWELYALTLKVSTNEVAFQV